MYSKQTYVYTSTEHDESYQGEPKIYCEGQEPQIFLYSCYCVTYSCYFIFVHTLGMYTLRIPKIPPIVSHNISHIATI